MTAISSTEAPRLDSFGVDVEEDEAETRTFFDLLGSPRTAAMHDGELG